MNAREWLRSRAGKRAWDGNLRQWEAVEGTITTATGESPRRVAVLRGITVAEASANLTALAEAVRHGDATVRCGCWPRYIGECRCADKGVRLPC